MYRAYVAADFATVKRLAGAGMTDGAIARELDFPRATVRRWMAREDPPLSVMAQRIDWRPACRGAYAYVLGAYLGDGHIYRGSARGWRLGFTFDRAYPLIIDEVEATLQRAYPSLVVCRNLKPGAIGLYASGVDWSLAFPQHGRGKKHDRPIVLAGWQRAITREHPRALLRGLIHSDGCRTINRFETRLPSGRVGSYAYPRYFFSNLSADIRAIFCEHCDLLGIRWTQSNHRNISVAHRRSTAVLDAFVGPKR